MMSRILIIALALFALCDVASSRLGSHHVPVSSRATGNSKTKASKRRQLADGATEEIGRKYPTIGRPNFWINLQSIETAVHEMLPHNPTKNAIEGDSGNGENQHLARAGGMHR